MRMFFATFFLVLSVWGSDPIINEDYERRTATRRDLLDISAGFSSDLLDFYADKPIVRPWHVIYIQRPFEDPEVSAAKYASKIDEIIELQNNAMEFHRVPHRITKGNVYVKDSSLYYETKDSCSTALAQCLDWANEYGRVEGAWDLWMCSVSSTWHPDCGGLAWQPGDVSFMGEYSWYTGRCGDNGILHEMGHNFNADHDSGFCYPEVTNGQSSDEGWITMMGGGAGCVQGWIDKKIWTYTDATITYCEPDEGLACGTLPDPSAVSGDHCVTLGDSANDNGSRMRQRLHDLLMTIGLPQCPGGDYRNVCISMESHFCDSNVWMTGMFNSAQECAQHIIDHPSICPGNVFGFSGMGGSSWGCRCCNDGLGSGSTITEHPNWDLYEPKVGGTYSPSIRPAFVPTSEPTTVVPSEPTEPPTQQPPVSISFVAEQKACAFTNTILGDTEMECAQFMKSFPNVCPTNVFASSAAGWDCRCCEIDDENDFEFHSWWNLWRLEESGASTADMYFDPENGVCPSGYTMQENVKVNDVVPCAGSLYYPSCILPKAEAEAYCQMIECFAVSGTTNAGWESWDNEAVEISIMATTTDDNSDWRTCVLIGDTDSPTLDPTKEPTTDLSCGHDSFTSAKIYFRRTFQIP